MRSKAELIAEQLASAVNVKNIWSGIVDNVKAYGAVGDGVTDDTAAIQKTIDYAISLGKKEITFPAGSYKYSTLSNTNGLTFVGDGVTLTGSPTLALTSLASLQTGKANQADLEVTNANVATAQTTANTARTEQIGYTRLIDNDIPSSKFRQAADEDKIKLANLSLEVRNAMAGTTTIGTTPAPGSVTAKELANGAVGMKQTAYLMAEGRPSKNLFNKTAVTKGIYVDFNNGLTPSAGGYTASEFIAVTPSTDYVLAKFSTGTDLAFYTSGKVYISGVASASDTIRTPSNCYFVRFTTMEVFLDVQQFELGTVRTSYTNFYPKAIIDGDTIENKPTILTVRKDGKGNFTTIPLALASITDNSIVKPYLLLIGEGVFTDKEWFMKPYVSLEGEGIEKSWIKGENPASASDSDTANISTFWWNCTGCTIKNLKITAKNMRYPIHSDAGETGNKEGKLKMINCHIEHYGNQEVIDYRAANSLPAGNPWMSWSPFGCGVSDGEEIIAENTTFTSQNVGFYYHTNKDFTQATRIVLNNCKCIAQNDNGDSVMVQSMGSHREDLLELYGCQLRGDISYSSPSWLSPIPADNHAEIKIVGSGNTPVLFNNAVVGIGGDYYPEFNDEYDSLKNTSGATISKGMAVCYNTSYYNIRKMTNVDAAALFVGIAREDIPSGGTGKVKIKGFLKDTEISMSVYNASTFGANYGISSSAGQFVIGATPVIVTGVKSGVIKI